ncbi:MAG: isoleucine--tRNA ligase [Candidatus Omnitrophica bacterium]|nr:isoleucine--tRNA ligase [Candidatus Omnitrophota bacterium]
MEINYKNTLNLPQTDFSMKANLPQREPAFLEQWQRRDIYGAMQQRAAGRPVYVLHDGPPYANGHIHIGHALNKILKDIIVKYKTMAGYRVPYVPGWDCHGLPVEHQLFKELGKRKDEVEQVDFRKKAHDYALKFVAVQREEFKRLGIFGEWDNPYLTLAPHYEAGIIRAFGMLVRNGLIYRGCKPVNWCAQCETALAEAEVEYEEHTSASIFVRFAVSGALPAGTPNLGNSVLFMVIWTTTPWTLLGNVACAVHPDFTYALIRVNDREVYVIEEKLAPAVLARAGISGSSVVGTLAGRQLEHVQYTHPFLSRPGKVVLADYVSAEDGSGVVHIAPGYGAEDFQVGRRYGLETVMQVDAKGRFGADVPEVGGLHIQKAAKRVIELLQSRGALVFAGTIQHSYPHCWRCKEPILFRATEQWFMRIDHDQLRERALAKIQDVCWVPESGQNRIAGMIHNRPDWCLSRQRLWGVPIPAFYCRGCQSTILSPEVIEQVAALVEREGTDCWFIRPPQELLPAEFACPQCRGKNFAKETDILDVWFDSGVSHYAVLRAAGRKNLGYPADLYLEGSDQHRGWFQSSLLAAMGMDGTAPFKTVLTHGFTVDGEGRKMSKSRGNVISPQEVIDKLGADVLRLCIASSNYSDDVRMSNEILSRVSESYRKIRNTWKFMLGNLSDFNPQADQVDYASMLEIDRWAVSAAHALLQQVGRAYEAFTFYQAVKLVYNFCVVELSSFYLDILKDRMYTFAAAGLPRRSGQTALYEILSVLVRIIAPVLPFTAEEAYQAMPGAKEESIFFTAWPAVKACAADGALQGRWQSLVRVREAVLKELEAARGVKLIGNSLDARVTLRYRRDDPLAAVLVPYQDQWPAIFIVSQVVIEENVDSPGGNGYTIELTLEDGKTISGTLFVGVAHADGEKCVRCWNYAAGVGSHTEHPSLCTRCYGNLPRTQKAE